MPKNSPKTCPQCQTVFLKNYSRPVWARVIYCGTKCNAAAKRIPPSDRFWNHVGAASPSGCREWTGALSDGRYGHFWDGESLVKAHIFSWEESNGKVPAGLKVCHKCDNPKCVEKTHLFLGTQKENLADMLAKDRSCRGERSGHAVLRDEDVIAIRASKDRNGVLAERYGVSPSVITAVQQNRTWRHLIAP